MGAVALLATFRLFELSISALFFATVVHSSMLPKLVIFNRSICCNGSVRFQSQIRWRQRMEYFDLRLEGEPLAVVQLLSRERTTFTYQKYARPSDGRMWRL